MNIPPHDPGQLLIGIAVTVPEPYGSELQEARARFGDPWAGGIPPHVTLLAPTVIDAEQASSVREHLDEIAARHAPFVLRLRGTGTFRPVSQVAFVQVADGIAACELLESDVRSGPLAQELRFHYHPHVTVAHDLTDEQLDVAMDELAEYDASFVVSGFHCYRHGDDGVWRPEREHKLTGRAHRP